MIRPPSLLGGHFQNGFWLLRDRWWLDCNGRLCGQQFRLGAALSPQDAFLHDALDLQQRLVLDLANAFLGHADDLADLFQRERLFFRLLPPRSGDG